MEEHEKEARANIAVDSFLWAREGEHKGTVVHQCQLLDRIAEKGQVWIKWTSTGKIGCIPKSNIEEPTTQSRERKCTNVVVSHVEVINQKKQRKSKSTGDAKSPVPLLMETTIPPFSRKTRSSGAKRVDDQSSVPGLQTVSRQLPMSKNDQSSKSNAAASTRGEKKKRNVIVAQESMMTSSVLVGTADVNDDFEMMTSSVLVDTADGNDDFESPDNNISQPTEIGPVNSATVEVTVDDVNTEVNSKLRAIEAMDLMEHSDGGDSDEEGFELDFHNDAVRPCVTFCAAKSDGVSEGAVSDDDLDIEYIDDLVGEAW